MRSSENLGATLTTNPYRQRGYGDRRGNSAELLEHALLKAEQRIAALESELGEKQAALDHLKREDARLCQELTELQEMLWYHHRGLPSCQCKICVEVERYRKETEGLV